ncbi:MAG: cation diffusion facilitator family transporter [Candidatus Aminicenantes bacterium]|nr:cation diffusion facilitator family transporter [Candidatus Aminicenantes bacterium]
MRFLKSRRGAGYFEGWLSITINVLLFSAKLLIGRQLGSVAMVADAWHTLSDSLTSVLVILSFRFSSRPADDRHHFGHGRFEAIGSVIIGTLLAVIGFRFLQESINRLIHHQGIVYSTLAIFVFLFSAILKEALALFSFWLGKKIKSSSLMADAWHHRSDAIASALIVLGAFVDQKFWWVDGLLGIAVSGLILLAVASIFRRSVSYLLGESPSKQLEREVKQTILNTDDRLTSVHHLHLHEYGEHREITVHVRLPADMNLEEAHEIATRAERDLREKLKLEATIHLEPKQKEKVAEDK